MSGRLAAVKDTFRVQKKRNKKNCIQAVCIFFISKIFAYASRGLLLCTVFDMAGTASGYVKSINPYTLIFRGLVSVHAPPAQRKYLHDY
jgi:hypothetical protein